MNWKRNPIVSLVGLILLAAILVLVCAGCETNTAETSGDENPARFTVKEAEADGPGWCYIITDTETGVQYLFVSMADGRGGLAVLQTGEEAPNE